MIDGHIRDSAAGQLPEPVAVGADAAENADGIPGVFVIFRMLIKGNKSEAIQSITEVSYLNVIYHLCWQMANHPSIAFSKKEQSTLSNV